MKERTHIIYKELLHRVWTRKYYLIFTIAISFICVFAFMAYSSSFSHNIYSNSKEIELTYGKTITQNFIAPEDNLSTIGLFFSKTDSLPTENYKFNLYDSESNLLQSIMFSSVHTQNQREYEFFFSPIKNSKNKTFKIELSSTVGNQDEYLKVVATPKDEEKVLTSNNFDNSLGLCLEIRTLTYKKSVVLFAFILTLFALLLIVLYSKNVAKNAYLTILFFGVCFCFLTPITDTPDETPHFTRAYAISQGKLSLSKDTSQNFVSLPAELHDFMYPLGQTTIVKAFKNNHFEINSSKINDTSIDATKSYSFVSYIPQAIGIFIARVLHLGPAWYFYLGRLLNLLLYAFMVYYAVKLIPFYKVSLFLASTMPMLVYISSSFNQDALLYGASALLVAYYVRLYTCEDNNITWRKMLGIIGCVALMCLSKVPYAIFGVLFFIIPRKKYKDKKTYIMSYGAILTYALIGIGWFLYTQTMGIAIALPNLDAKRQFVFMLNNPSISLRIMLVEIVTHFKWYFESMFYFGWFTKNISYLSTFYFPIFIAFIVLDKGALEIKKYHKVMISILSIFVILMVALSMYLTWTYTGRLNILGIQGRYFAPLFMLLPIILTVKRDKNYNIKNFELNGAFFSLIMLLSSSILLLNFYF